MPENTGDARPLLLGGARLADGRLVDVRIAGRRIEAVGTAGSLTTRGKRLDLRGHLLLPAPAEPHAHADTALTGPREARRRTGPRTSGVAPPRRHCSSSATGRPRCAPMCGSAAHRASPPWRGSWPRAVPCADSPS